MRRIDNTSLALYDTLLNSYLDRLTDEHVEDIHIYKPLLAEFSQEIGSITSSSGAISKKYLMAKSQRDLSTRSTSERS